MITGVLSGQDASQKIRFLFLDESPGAYGVRNRGELYQPIRTRPFDISAPLRLQTSGTTVLLKTNPTRDPETGEFRRIPVANIIPPPGSSSILAVITPSPPDSEGNYNFKVDYIDNSPDSLPLGSIRILNRGRSRMAAQFGTEQIIVPVGENRIIRPSTDENNQVRVRYRVAVEGDDRSTDKWELLTDNVVTIRENERATGVLLYSASGMRHLFGNEITAEMGAPTPTHFWKMYYVD